MIRLYKKIIALLFISCFYTAADAQVTPWSVKMSATAMKLWGTGSPSSWTYEKGLILKSVEKVYDRTADVKYSQYIQTNIDYFLKSNGGIRTYSPYQYTLDNVNMGRSLLFLYNLTGTQKYKTAADTVRLQLYTHPRTTEGGFWHKQIYPYQMWLDGLYMAEPFYAEYSGMVNEPQYFDDILNQFSWMENHTRNTSTGLLYHGWDESKNESWSDPVTGCSQNFWGRAIGWYAMGLVDVLDYFPQTHPKRDTLINILKRLSTAIVNYQNVNSGLWYQVVDKASTAGNYPESSASCMFVYALAKGVRKGYLDKTKLDAAMKGYDGILTTFVTTDAQSVSHLKGTCQVAGLGGTPYRDGTYAYYISTPVVQDDPKGVGAFILASVEIETAKEAIITGITADTKNNISVSPNPVTDLIYINTQDQQGFTFNIFNCLSQPVLSGHTSPIDMSAWAPGVYYMKIQGPEGTEIKKIVKQ
jgi:unsaturated rhamnogalacturonyl hydrolase